MERTVNNKFKSSPAIMNDGRSFTDYRPACYVDTMIANANKLHGSNDYRQFLIQNGLQLMKVNDMYLENKMTHRECNNAVKPGSHFAKVCSYQPNTQQISCLMEDPGHTGIYNDRGGKMDAIEGYDKMESNFQKY